jgi:metal-dependent amidase/aminoacylase/carboxypeptidase family protein
VIALRADMDALPIHETSGVEHVDASGRCDLLGRYPQF